MYENASGKITLIDFIKDNLITVIVVVYWLDHKHSLRIHPVTDESQKSTPRGRSGKRCEIKLSF